MHKQLVPTIPGFYSDPSICRVGDVWYLTTSSFEYFPGCPLFRSYDLFEWEQVGYILDRPEQLPLDNAWISGGIYAPALRFHDDRLYCITTNQSASRPPGGGSFIVHTDEPEGQWSDPIWIDGMHGIDPDLFWDVDGTCYAQWSLRVPPRRGPDDICIGQATIDPLTGRLLEDPRIIWQGTGGLGPEGPHLYRVGEYYLLLIAEGGTDYGHMVTVARSLNPRGPYEPCPHNPVLTHRSRPTRVHAVGHADLVEAPNGDWFGVCHGIRPMGSFPFQVLGRETFAFPMDWDADGWPIPGENGMLPQETITAKATTVFADDFSDTNWPLEWNYLRNPDPKRYERGTGKLVLHGTSDSITSFGRPTWLGIRQRDHRCCFEAELSITLDGDGEAGLTAFQNCQYHLCIGLQKRNGSLGGFTRARIGEFCIEEEWAVNDDVHSLFIEAEEQHYHLGVHDADGRRRIRSFQARLLSREFGGRFTGVFFALYAEAASRISSNKCRYEPNGDKA